MIKRALIAAVAAACLTCAGNAATIVPYKHGYALKLEGLIEEGDSFRLLHAHNDSCHKYQRCPERVFLNSDGGIMGPAADTAEIVRALELDTVVAKGEICASACFLIFAAGKHRVLRVGAYLGIHMVHYADDTPVEPETIQYWVTWLRAWHVPYKVIMKFASTPSGSMAWLQYDDTGDWVETVK